MDTGRFEFPDIGPGITIFSDSAPLPKGPTPITVAVEFMRFDFGQGTVTSDFPKEFDPQERVPNPVLTVYYVDDGTLFRVGVTNLAQLPINTLTVRWWRLDV